MRKGVNVRWYKYIVNKWINNKYDYLIKMEYLFYDNII